MNKPHTILLCLPTHHLFHQVHHVLANQTTVLFAGDLQDTSEEVLVQKNPDMVVSFMNPRILKGALLEVANVNFHPAPPRFPDLMPYSKKRWNMVRLHTH